jgi:LPXTG-motif cell wall-anchored protein
MDIINKFYSRYILSAVFLTMVLFQTNGQTTMPEELLKNTLKEQLNYLEGRTKIYDNYRAIREDMFQKIKGNIRDSVTKASETILMLKQSVATLNITIDTLRASLETTNNNLQEVTRTKESIRLLGIEVNKTTYNSMMWFIIAGLTALLLLGFLIFKKNLYTIHHINKDLVELKGEFEAYRKSSREAREKMSKDHFNEIKKLKGG